MSVCEWKRLLQEVSDISSNDFDDSIRHRISTIELLAFHAPPDESPGMRSELLSKTALVHFYMTEEPRNALPSAKVAVHLAEVAGDLPRLRRALTILGIAAADTNDIGMAIHCYGRALQLAGDLQDVQARCAILNNLGTAFLSSASYKDAIRCYEHVVLESHSLSNGIAFQILASAMSNKALCHFHLAELDAGIEAMEAAFADIKEPCLGFEYVVRVLMEYTYTRLLLSLGDLKKAGERSRHALRYSLAWRAPRATVAAQNAIALVEVFNGDLDIGMRRLTRSLAKSGTLKSSRRDTLAALVMASERADRIDLAIGYQRDLLSMTSQAVISNVQFHHEMNVHGFSVAQVPCDDAVLELARGHLERLNSKQGEFDDSIDQLEALERIAMVAGSREDPSGGHSYRVARLVSLLGKRLGLASSDCRLLDQAVRLHDIGYVAVPDSLFRTARGLNQQERELIQAHTTFGADLLRKYDDPQLRIAAEVARSHHERWDGHGYPDGLAGNRIPMSARMTGIAESFDAMTHHRNHRNAVNVEHALGMLETCAGTLHEPSMLREFVLLIRDLTAAIADFDEFLESGARTSRYVLSRSKIETLLVAK